MASKGTQFKRQTDLKRSSGLRLSTPIRSLVERVATEAGLTYSDALRLLVEEALAARAGEVSKVKEMLLIEREIGKDWTRNLGDRMQALSTIEQTALVRLERKLQDIGSWLQTKETPGAFLVLLEEQARKIDAMQWQIEKVFDLLAEKEVG